MAALIIRPLLAAAIAAALLTACNKHPADQPPKPSVTAATMSPLPPLPTPRTKKMGPEGPMYSR